MENEISSMEAQSNNTKFVKINEIRVSERPTLTIEEAAALYNIGENMNKVGVNKRPLRNEGCYLQAGRAARHSYGN